MKKIVLLLAITALTSTMMLAQSSGNFSTAYFPNACAINDSGTPGGVTFTGGACLGSTNADGCKVLDAAIKTSAGSGVTLVITPSAVTGLYTDTKVSNNITTSTAEIGLQVCVKVDGKAANVVGGDKDGCVIMDERLQQVSQNFLAGVSQVANCSTTAGAGDNTCFLDFLQATLAAHSYNLVAQVPNGQHEVTAAWSIVNANTVGDSHVGACLGPGNVTVTQTKVFNNSGSVLQE